jgi:hypothetical protein
MLSGLTIPTVADVNGFLEPILHQVRQLSEFCPQAPDDFVKWLFSVSCVHAEIPDRSRPRIFSPEMVQKMEAGQGRSVELNQLSHFGLDSSRNPVTRFPL